MPESRSFWGGISAINGGQDIPDIPQKILKDQAEFLTSQTKGILIGEVVEGVKPKNSIYSCHLRITVPALGHYIYNVLKINYPIEEIYPGTVISSHDEKYECKDVDEYEAILERILSSEQLKHIVSLLLAQASIELKSI
ncbi:MAG: hypothetical protein AAGD25_08525 [Cyanobacteria bacterium P01_F01_bin.150]